MYIHVYVCTFIYAYNCTYIHIFTHTYVYIYIHVLILQLCMRVLLRILTCIRTCTQTIDQTNTDFHQASIPTITLRKFRHINTHRLSLPPLGGRACVRSLSRKHTHTHTHTHVHLHTHTHIHIHRHTLSHTHTHLPTLSPSLHSPCPKQDNRNMLKQRDSHRNCCQI